MATGIGIVVYPGAQLAAIHGLADLFSLANRFATQSGRYSQPPLAVSLWTVGQRSDGLSPPAFHSDPPVAERPTIVIVPPTMVDLPDPALRSDLAEWLIALHADGVFLATICSGVALIAETGLLNGRAVSTHRNFVPYLRENHPDVIVDLDERIIDYPDILTAGGFLSWVDVGLLLIERLLGSQVHEQTGGFLRSETQAADRPGPQRFLPPLVHGDLAVQRAQRHVHMKDGRGIDVTAMAAAAQLSRRTLIRRFTKATGLTPLAYCRAVRIGRARELLDSSALAPKEIAERLGYVDVSSFTRAFRQIHGMPPAAYRRKFGGAVAAHQALRPADPRHEDRVT